MHNPKYTWFMKLHQMPKIGSGMDVLRIRMAMAFFLVAVAFLGTAYEYPEKRQSPQTGQFESEASAKLTRGFTNLLFGWTEIVRTPTRMSTEPNVSTLQVLGLGIPYGIARAVARTVIGVFEMATFYSPQVPIMEPIQGDLE
jgi:putative exosortase-associated protein (TIGR04073 family)